jgi:tetratricopeptide (TPR) repeat protein
MSQVDKQKAIQFLNEGRLEEAYAAFRDVVNNYPEDWLSYDALAYLEINLKKNLEEATNLIEKARDYGCPSTRYHQVRANILWSKGQLEEATLELERAVNADPSVDNLIALANNLMNTNYKRTLPLWQEIIKKYPSNVLAYLALAWIARRETNWTLALAMATKARNLQPKNPKVLFAVGQAYQELNQCKYALKYYLEADKQGFAEKFIIQGSLSQCHLQLHNYVKALEHAYEAAKLDPQNSQAKEPLNKCKEYLLWLCRELRYSEAYPRMETALNIWPDDSKLLACMAVLQMEFKHNYELGQHYMHKALECNNADLDLLYEIKGCLWFDHLNDRKEGLACLEKAVSLNPTAFNLVALAARISDSDPGRAKQIYEELLKSDSKNVEVIYGLAKVNMKQGKWIDGLELAIKGCQLQPSNPSINCLLAFAHFNLGRIEEALKYYQKAEKLEYPDKAYVYNSIAACYQKLGKARKARQYARKALNINPDDEEAKNFFRVL